MCEPFYNACKLDSLFEARAKSSAVGRVGRLRSILVLLRCFFAGFHAVCVPHGGRRLDTFRGHGVFGCKIIELETAHF